MLEVIQGLLVTPEGLLIDLGLILIVAAFAAYVIKAFKQPLIPAYIIAGLILGPVGFGIIHDVGVINSISELGIMFLLFIVGLELDLRKLKSVGWTTIITGALQVMLTFIAGFYIANWLGFSQLNSIYAGLIVAFSSTMVVIKLLFDENELNTLHGRIILGILFVQDVFVILALTIFMGTSEFTIINVLPLLGKFIVLAFIAYIFNRFFAFRMFRSAAKSNELLLLMAVAFCFLFALLAYLFGYSIAMGAFFGGITLANLPYSTNIIGSMMSLKDFFATIFFVSLGLQLVLSDIIALIQPLLILLGVILILKPLIILIILSVLGYDKRNSFATAISLGQISEFSLILVMGVSNISQELFTITILLAIITIVGTSYIMKYEMFFYNKLIPALVYLEKLSIKKRDQNFVHSRTKKKVLLFGSRKMGEMFLRSLKRVKKHLLVVDFDPEVIEDLRGRKISSFYGDMTNPEILKHINFEHAKVIISAIPNSGDNLRLLKYLREVKSRALTFVTAITMAEALDLYDAGADYVIIPAIMSGESVAVLLEKYMDDPKTLRKIKRKHLKHLLEMNSEK